MSKKERSFFMNYLIDKGYEERGKKYYHGYVVIYFMHRGEMFSGEDTNPSHKHKHIATSLSPLNKRDADVLYYHLQLDKKSIGSKEWSILKNKDKNV